MSDSLLFASLFACYGVLGRNYAGGPSGAEIFELPLVAVNTVVAAALFDHLRFRSDRDTE
jgi:cytochrome o ubiquinol oxidase subunit 3